MDNLKTEALGNGNGSAHNYKAKGQKLEQGLESFTHNAGEKIGTMASDLASSTTDYIKSGRDYVQDNPVKGVAVAAAAGVVAGFLMSFAMRRRTP